MNKPEATSENTPSTSRQEFYLPMVTVFRLLLVVLFVYCLKILAPLLMTLFLACLIAVSLEPVIYWLENKGLKRIWAIAWVTFLLAGIVSAIIAIIVPSLFAEFSNFINNIPRLKEQILESLSLSNPLRPLIEKGLSKEIIAPSASAIAPIYSAGHMALGGFIEVVLVFVFSIYLLVDGKSALDWLIAFFSVTNQEKIKKTMLEITPIISSYIAGQMITSFISFLYVLIVLNCLGVPNSLLLATLAGLFDVLPVLGFFLAVIPAILFAIPISGSTAVIVFFLYVLYHAIENYFIIPAVYGKRLRVSGFVVLFTLIAAGMLAGLEGAITILPIVASYPIIERIWLKKIVGSSTIEEHRN